MENLRFQLKNVTKRVLQVMTGLAFVLLLSILLGVNDLRAQATGDFVADSVVSQFYPGWEGRGEKAVFFISKEGGSNAAKNKWISIYQPFPMPVTGVGDSYVQTVIGLSLMGDGAVKSGMSWFLLAAKQGHIDAIMLIAMGYASNQTVKNTVEAERWLRKAIELGNQDAENLLNNMLAGQSTDSFSFSTSYNYHYKVQYSNRSSEVTLRQGNYINGRMVWGSSSSTPPFRPW